MDWSKVAPGVPEKVLELGDSYLKAQLQLATSGDQRAAVMASVFAAAGAAILAGTMAFLADAAWSNPGISIGGLTMASTFLIGAGLCAWATLPAKMCLPGNEPESWKCEIEAGLPLAKGICDEVENCQQNIEENEKMLARNARRFKAGAVVGITAPAVGFLAWLLVTAFSSPSI